MHILNTKYCTIIKKMAAKWLKNTEGLKMKKQFSSNCTVRKHMASSRVLLFSMDCFSLYLFLLAIAKDFKFIFGNNSIFIPI